MCFMNHTNNFVFKLPNPFYSIFVFGNTEVPPLSVTSCCDVQIVQTVQMNHNWSKQ